MHRIAWLPLIFECQETYLEKLRIATLQVLLRNEMHIGAIGAIGAYWCRPRIGESSRPYFRSPRGETNSGSRVLSVHRYSVPLRALKLAAAGPPKGSKKARVEERSPKEKEAEGGTSRGSSSAATAGRRGRTGDGARDSRGAAAKPFSVQLEFVRINRGASVCNRSLTLSPSSWLLLAHVSAIGQCFIGLYLLNCLG